ncbi:MAG: aldehyde dehydrogenase family protein [Steroidobacteraceae bacterium]
MSIQALAQHDRSRWQAVATKAQKKLETRLFIDGKFVDAKKGGRFTSVNPATGEPFAEVSAGTAEDIDRAVQAARKAFRSGAWSKMAPRARMEVMNRFAALIDEHAESIAVLDTLDMGKPIADVIGIDLPAVVETIRFMAECIDKVEGAVTSTESGVVHMVLREPYGVVGAISPWNYPLLMATWKIAPALAAGNTVVLKPAEQAPLSCLRLAQLFMEAGGPAGVFNVVNGLGEEAGRALALHDEVRKITFTGSTAVGKLILQYAGQSNMKQVALECGGKTPQVFMADIEDLDRAVTAAYRGIYTNMGEVCNAGSRLLVDRSIRKKFVERFIELGQDAFKPGDPLDPATNMGPLVTREDQKRVLGLIEKGRKEGAKLEFGGDTPAKLKQGA